MNEKPNLKKIFEYLNRKTLPASAGSRGIWIDEIKAFSV
jgi:hypothetical protein